MFGGNFAPTGWLFCNGQLLNISQYDVLYTLLGTTYGGDGVNTFGLPDLRGRTPIHQGQGNGLTNRAIGQSLGAETVTLTAAQVAPHFHPVIATTSDGTAPGPKDNTWAQSSEAQYSTANANGVMAAAATGITGGGLPHENMMPFQAVSFIIATEGVFPNRS